MVAREKVDDSAPRRIEYFEIVEYANTYEKLDKQNVPFWISNFQSSMVKIYHDLHIEEALVLFVTTTVKYCRCTNGYEICPSKLTDVSST